MFTVKLVKGDAVKIVAAVSVDVVPAALGGGREIACTDEAGSCTRYEVARGGAYAAAYIENAAGQTTQIVRPK
jgi:hypothetical protein